VNPWLQSKQYTCLVCGASYLHDRAYAHSLFECPFRLMTAQRVPVIVGRSYELKVKP